MRGRGVFTSAEVRDAAGQPIDTAVARADAADPTTMGVSLAPGACTAEWRAMSADTHKTKANFSFRVGDRCLRQIKAEARNGARNHVATAVAAPVMTARMRAVHDRNALHSDALRRDTFHASVGLETVSAGRSLSASHF